MRRLRAVIAVSVMVAVVSSSVAASVEASPDRVFVQRAPGSEQTLYYRPHVFYLSADGAFYLTGVKWRHYGGRTAMAVATAHTNNCLPACLGGTYSTHPTKVRLTGRKTCLARGGREIYADLSFRMSGDVPENFGNGRESISMRPVNIHGGPLC